MLIIIHLSDLNQSACSVNGLFHSIGYCILKLRLILSDRSIYQRKYQQINCAIYLRCTILRQDTNASFPWFYCPRALVVPFTTTLLFFASSPLLSIISFRIAHFALRVQLSLFIHTIDAFFRLQMISGVACKGVALIFRLILNSWSKLTLFEPCQYHK